MKGVRFVQAAAAIGDTGWPTIAIGERGANVDGPAIAIGETGCRGWSCHCHWRDKHDRWLPPLSLVRQAQATQQKQQARV